MKRFALLLFCCFAVLFSCSTPSKTSKKHSQAQKMDTTLLLNSTWKLITMDKKAYTDTKAYLEFKNDLSRFYGNNGCNFISGDLTFTADSVAFSKIVSTKMFCDNQDFTNRFSSLLLSSVSANFKNDTLTLLNDKNEEVLQFKK